MAKSSHWPRAGPVGKANQDPAHGTLYRRPNDACSISNEHTDSCARTSRDVARSINFKRNHLFLMLTSRRTHWYLCISFVLRTSFIYSIIKAS